MSSYGSHATTHPSPATHVPQFESSLSQDPNFEGFQARWIAPSPGGTDA
jgi:hypothetical protein